MRHKEILIYLIRRVKTQAPNLGKTQPLGPQDVWDYSSLINPQYHTAVQAGADGRCSPKHLEGIRVGRLA